MTQPRRLSMPGMALALAGGVAMLVAGADIVLVIAVLLLWGGSLWLVGSQPPPPPPAKGNNLFTRDSMKELIENAGTPLLLTERSRIAVANRAAREVLGPHVVGQDIRVALRHPEAIALFDRRASGSAAIRGLVRPRDIWRINRQQMEDELAVVELINRTSEADISRAHTDFVANASHELRTPLASIIGYVETLAEADDIEPDQARKFLDTIRREARRLQNLVNDLMSLSRVEAEKHERPAKVVELASLVERAARDAAGSERVERLEFTELEPLQAQGDTQQLEQLVRNLVDNALKYGDETEKVSIAVRRHGDGEALFTVRDRGEGIAPDHIPHLTRRFYRTDPGRSRATGGTGLGLAIVKHIVERHRGRLDIESQLGEGTCVAVTIPVLNDQPTELS